MSRMFVIRMDNRIYETDFINVINKFFIKEFFSTAVLFSLVCGGFTD